MAQGITAHGTIVAYQPVATPNVFTNVQEVGDITMPGFSRNEFDITPHNRDIDVYILGVLRRTDVTFPIFWNKANTTHVALRLAIITNDTLGWKFTSPDGDILIFSGGLKE